jgi:FkbM family methyltransferase
MQKVKGNNMSAPEFGPTLVRKRKFQLCINVEYDSYNFWELYKSNAWEENTFNAFDRFLNSDFSYLDIGAWIGPTILYGAHLANSVYAFEPDCIAFGKLYANVALNSNLKDKIHLFNFGVADKISKSRLYIGTGATSMSSTIKNGVNRKKFYFADFYDMESTIEKAQIDIYNVNFIKIDIEGGEYNLIPHLADFLSAKDCFPTLYISTHIPFFIVDGASDNENKKIIHEKSMLLLEALKRYPYLYHADFSPVRDIKDIAKNEFMELIATSTPL